MCVLVYYASLGAPALATRVVYTVDNATIGEIAVVGKVTSMLGMRASPLSLVAPLSVVADSKWGGF